MREEIAQLIKPMTAQMSHLDVEERLIVLSVLVGQEICTVPVAERQWILDDTIARLPIFFTVMERKMREQLVQDARDGR